MRSILDKKFKYTSSGSTDIRKTFARIRRENKRQAERLKKASDAVGEALSAPVTILPRRVK